MRRFVRCLNATAEVRLRTFLSPCVDDCGPYGQCKLLRTHNYLYAACECKAGEQAGLVREPTRGVREPTRGAREGGGNLCSRVWRGWCGVRVCYYCCVVVVEGMEESRIRLLSPARRQVIWGCCSRGRGEGQL